MPRPYSNDRRSRVLQACDEGERRSRVAQRFRVGRASVYLWLKQRREESRDRPKAMGGGPQPVIRDAAEAALKRLVESDNHLTLTSDPDALSGQACRRDRHPRAPLDGGPSAPALAADAQNRRPYAPPSRTRP